MPLVVLARHRVLPACSRTLRTYATVSTPQTLVEKIVQKYAVDLPPTAKVRSGDYVMIRPEHV
jgi:homoaconitate hydratase